MTIEEQNDIEAELQKLIGEPYEHPRGCIKLVMQAFMLCGVRLELDPEADAPKLLADARKFEKTDTAQFGDVAVFAIPTEDGTAEKYHVAFMTGRRWAYQSSLATGGVGRIDVTRPEWAPHLRGFYRHEEFSQESVVSSKESIPPHSLTTNS